MTKESGRTAVVMVGSPYLLDGLWTLGLVKVRGGMTFTIALLLVACSLAPTAAAVEAAATSVVVVGR